jgi:hypothetical protein
VVLAVALLLPLFESVAVELIVAVLEIGPPGAEGDTRATMVNEAELLAVNVASVQLTAPPEPAAGVVQVNVGPLFCVTETKVVFAGSGSLMTVLGALDGPAFATFSVYVMVLPATAVADAVLAIERSALRVSVVLTVDVFGVVGSGDDEVTVAVLVIVPEADALV